jgi:perosamine synthetase
LSEQGIETRTFFCPMNMQPFLRKQEGHRDIPCPVAEGLWSDGFYLPSGNQLDRSSIARVCEAIAKARR